MGIHEKCTTGFARAAKRIYMLMSGKRNSSFFLHSALSRLFSWKGDWNRKVV